jgi:hypothetical protein
MRRFTSFSIRQRWVYGFFGALLVLGLSIYADYGISWDEDVSRATGMVSLRYVSELISPALVAYHHDGTYPPLAAWPPREYGVLFEAPACLLERLLHLDDVGARYRLRHLLTFLVCFGGVVALYQLARQRFGSWRLGLLAAAWLVLSPRLFAESFYNSKDAVFLALFAVAMLTGVRLLLRPTAGRAAWHALACAAAIDVRIMALVLPAATLGFLGLSMVGGKVSWRAVLPVAGLYLALLSGLAVAGWPYLWAAPWANLTQAFHDLSVFNWDNTVLYRGAAVRVTALPWHYAPVWISITTPLLYLGALLLGLLAVLRLLGPRQWRFWADDDQVQDLFFAALLVLPLLAVIVLHSVLYDGWRHLYFVYPALLLVALRGWVLAWQWLRNRRPRYGPAALGTATGLAMAITAGQMVAAHPNQQVYFNYLAGPNVATAYELDYWGLSFRQGLEYIAAHDSRAHLKVMANEELSPVARLNWNMLPAADRQRIQFTKAEPEADYFLSNYRWHPGPYPYQHEVHRVTVNGVRILSVFQLTPRPH